METTTTRAAISRFVAVIFAIVLPLATLATWGITTVTNTNRWVSTLHPLASNPVLTDYLAHEGAAIAIRELNVQNRLNKLLPEGTGFLSATLTTQLENALATAFNSALRTETFQSLWDRENRLTHQVAVAILQGRANSSIATAHSVVLNLSPTIISAITRVDRTGNHFFDPLKRALKNSRKFLLTILSPREIQRAQYYFRLATTLNWLLPLATLALAIAVVVTSRPRRYGLRRLACAVVASSAMSYCLLRIAINLAAPLAPTPVLVNEAILHTLTQLLGAELLGLLLAGAVSLALYWFSGDTASAQQARGRVQAFARTTVQLVSSRSRQISTTSGAEWFEQNRTQLERWLARTNVLLAFVALVVVTTWINSFMLLGVVAALSVIWTVVSRRLRQRLRSLEVPTPSDEGALDATATR